MPSTRRRRSYARLRGGLVHELRQLPQNDRVCFGWHTVPKVEYMTRPPSGTRENSARLGLDPLPRTDEKRGIEVALQAALVTDFRPPAVERDAPVEPDHAPAGASHFLQQGRRPSAEMDRGSVDRREDPSGVGRDELHVIRG